MDGEQLDPDQFVRHIELCEVRFTQSARRHRIGRGRVLEALQAPRIVIAMTHRTEWADRRTLILGSDALGRQLEIAVVIVDGGATALVIHAMHARPRYRLWT
jgi:hypothetical protein